MKEMDLNFVKSFKKIWVITPMETVYDLSTEKLFDTSPDGTFTDGWGHTWKYSEYMKTWSENPLDILLPAYEKRFPLFRRYELIEEVWKDPKLTQEQKDIMVTGLINGIYGTMYGEKYDKTKQNPKDNLIHIKHNGYLMSLDLGHFIKRATVNIHGMEVESYDLPPKEKYVDSFIHVWGMPGPDYSIYYIKDFGKSWGLKKSDITGDPADDIEEEEINGNKNN